jgi:hypothetical protein
MFHLFLRHWLDRMAGHARTGLRRNHPANRPPRLLHLETLEGRCLPSTVTNLNDAGAGSLRQAILDTPAGGTVDFQPGLAGTITLSGPLGIHQDLTIDGPGAEVITVSANHVSFVLGVDSGVAAAISGLTLADGYVEGTGGGIHNNGTLAITDSVIADNTSISDGGAILNQGTLSITGSTIRDNESVSRSAGGIFGGTVMIVDSTISGNKPLAIEDQGGA